MAPMPARLRETSFEVPKMDCPSEEQAIRTALSSAGSVRSLSFDLQGRQLTVLHDGEAVDVLALLVPLGFGARIEWSRECDAAPGARPAESGVGLAAEASTLWTVLLINAAMFVVELGFGLRAKSTGLVADSLDMFADAAVYGLALYAVRRDVAHQKRAARFSGVTQLALALLALAEVARRVIQGASAEPPTVVAVGMAAFLANSICLALLFRHRKGRAHMRASYIFTSTDVLANLGVVAGGALVGWLHTPWPDWVMGTLLATVVAWSALRILRLR